MVVSEMIKKRQHFGFVDVLSTDKFCYALDPFGCAEIIINIKINFKVLY